MKVENNEDAETCGKKIIKNFNINKVLITRGEKGLSLISKKRDGEFSSSRNHIFKRD